ncbi:hypothetical protein [Glaciecola sp. KUL10]|uniref:hypothetical protein n=1 Tax=Glaciecola sp. (strain KUL10) TaxID=2161813 RepID=UPI000D78785E|nr:hypothetical protein [Glaciecola sp. KUL10]GBL03147.1 hypothetical protein KUL10_04280 [Glaciecola sp. KUL10]
MTMISWSRLAILVAVLVLGACESTLAPNIETRANSQTTFDDFLKKTVVLPKSSAVDLSVYDTSLDLQANGHYVASTLYLLEMMPDTNLTWHYLGENAEALGLYDVAAVYYRNSDEAPWYNKFCSFKKNRTEGKAARYCKNYSPEENLARVNTYTENSNTLWFSAQETWEQEIRLANYAIQTDVRRFQSLREYQEKMVSGQMTYRSTNSGNEWTWTDVVTGIAIIAAIALGVDYIDSNPQQASVFFNSLSSSIPTTKQQAESKSTQKHISTSATTSECMSDYNCTYGLKCVKGFAQSRGVCMQTVNEIGIKTPYFPSNKSININTSMQQQCRFDSECPYNFRCEEELKVCVQ